MFLEFPYTKQQLFNISLEKIVEQGEPSVFKGTPQYFNFDDKKCAIGMILPEESFKNWMEGKEVYTVLPFFFTISNDMMDFADEIQRCHDAFVSETGDKFLSYFQGSMANVAIKYGLQAPTRP